MLRKMTLASVAILGLAVVGLAATATPAMAVEPQGIDLRFGIGRPVLPVPPGLWPRPDFRLYRVEYRSRHWQERTFHSQFEARRYADYLRDQGYNVRVDRHGFHFHVEYRLNRWETYAIVYSHAEAHRMEDFLRAQGYDTRVAHR